jgi:AMIN domain-containing protein
MTTSSTWAGACTLGLLLSIGLLPRYTQAQTTPVVLEQIAVVGSEQGLGIQITTNGVVTTEAQVLTGPDRLVIDFPGALPGRGLRGLRLNQGQIRAVRAGLWRSNPLVTRVVIDLNEPLPYRLVPSSRSILVRLGAQPAMASAENFPGVSVERRPTARALAALARGPEPPLRVGFDRGLLTISARKATLADVLYQVHLRTGAEIPIPSGADQEQVAIQAGPGPAKDVIAALLNGSRFNYVLQGTAQDPSGVGALILTPKANISEPSYTPPPVYAPPPQQPQGSATTGGDHTILIAPPNPPLQPNQETPPNAEQPQE